MIPKNCKALLIYQIYFLRFLIFLRFQEIKIKIKKFICYSPWSSAFNLQNKDFNLNLKNKLLIKNFY